MERTLLQIIQDFNIEYINKVDGYDDTFDKPTEDSIEYNYELMASHIQLTTLNELVSDDISNNIQEQLLDIQSKYPKFDFSKFQYSLLKEWQRRIRSDIFLMMDGYKHMKRTLEYFQDFYF